MTQFCSIQKRQKFFRISDAFSLRNFYLFGLAHKALKFALTLTFSIISTLA